MNATVQDIFAGILSSVCDSQDSEDATLACLDAAEDALAEELRVSVGRYASASR